MALERRPPPETCPLFGNKTEFSQVKSHDAWDLYRCADCGVLFWWPLKHPGGEYYEVPIFRSGRLQWRHRQFLKNPPVGSGRLLDVGSGLGTFLAAARKKGFEPWGVDIAEVNVNFSKETHGLTNVFVGDLKSLAEKPNAPQFDVITMFELIEHVEDPGALLEEVKGVLRPRGFLALSTPNFNRVRLGRPYWGEDWPPHHFWLWPPRTLARLLESRGFEVLRVVEEPLGRDFLWLSLQKSERFWRLKDRVIRLVSPKRSWKESGAPAIPKKRDLLMGDTLVFVKDAVVSTIAFPLSLLSRVFGWKYWDMYILARLKESPHDNT